MSDYTPTKVCSKCGIEKPATPEFWHKQARGIYGLWGICKDCRNESRRKPPRPPKQYPEFKVCPHCGIEKPATTEFFYKNSRTGWVTSYCKVCHNMLTVDWMKRNPERIKDNQRKLRLNNLDRYRTKDKIFRMKYKTKRAEYEREYRRSNPDKKRVRDNRRKARKLNLPDTFTIEQWFACLEYFNYCCAVCGNQLRDLFGNVEPHADHWIPLSYEGDDNPGTVAENMVCLCSDCNQNKKDTLPHVWLERKYGVRKGKQILNRINTYFMQTA